MKTKPNLRGGLNRHGDHLGGILEGNDFRNARGSYDAEGRRKLHELRKQSSETAAELFATAERFIWQLARRTNSRYQHVPMTVEDWFQEFALGIVKYAHRFDPARGNALTFARYACKGVTAYVMAGRMRQCRQAEGVATFSYHAMATTTTGNPIADMIGDDRDDPAPQIEHADTVATQTTIAERLLDKLEPIDRVIIEARFGLGDGREYKPAEIGEALGITRQGAHHRVNRALCAIGAEGGDDATA